MEIQAVQKSYSGEQSNIIFQFKQQQSNNHRDLERKTI